MLTKLFPEMNSLKSLIVLINKMKEKISKFVYWTPRILSILFVAFLMVFSLDVFDMKLGFFGTILGLFMHNLIPLALLIITIISWKREIVGGIAFILAGLLYGIRVIRAPFELYMLLWIAQISGPAIFIGILYMLNWKRKKK